MTIGFEIANRPIMHLMNYSEEIMPDVTSYMGIIYAGLIVTAAITRWQHSCVHWGIPNHRSIF